MLPGWLCGLGCLQALRTRRAPRGRWRCELHGAALHHSLPLPHPSSHSCCPAPCLRPPRPEMEPWMFAFTVDKGEGAKKAKKQG